MQPQQDKPKRKFPFGKRAALGVKHGLIAPEELVRRRKDGQ